MSKSAISALRQEAFRLRGKGDQWREEYKVTGLECVHDRNAEHLEVAASYLETLGTQTCLCGIARVDCECHR